MSTVPRFVSSLALLFSLIFLPISPLAGQSLVEEGSVDYLQECCEKQIPSRPDHDLSISYREVERRFYHSPRPWMTRQIPREGSLRVGERVVVQFDTVKGGGKEYVTTMQVTPEELLQRNYRGDEVTSVTPTELRKQPLLLARYTPIPLLERARQALPSIDLEARPDYALYRFDVAGEKVELAIRRSDSLLEGVRRTWYDEMLGDVTEEVNYSRFGVKEGLYYPTEVMIDQGHGLRDTVAIVNVTIATGAPLPLERPEGYVVREEEESGPEVKVERISDHLFSISYAQSESRSVLVEFNDFFAVIDVPFSSSNGELLLAEAEKICPGKPVRYFAFDHHHPWYLGGVRPFIHRGATILSTESDLDYVRYLAGAPHTLQPDSLHLDPKPLKTGLVDSIMTITDGSYQMQVIHIGMRSKHTEDYLLFYFPEEKIVVHGDLAWIRAEGDQGKGSDREEGLYNAIRELDLDAEKIVQTWPVAERYGVKSIYSFEELRRKVGGED